MTSFDKKGIRLLAAVLSAAALLCACSSKDSTAAQTVSAQAVQAATDWDAVKTSVDILLPQASGQAVYNKDDVAMDYSNADSGYIMLRSDAPYKVRIAKDDLTYTYDLEPGDWCTYTLSQGAGTYEVRVLKQVIGNTYAVLFSVQVQANIADEITPFLYPSQYVNYDAESRAVLWSYALCNYAGTASDTDKAALFYRYVADNIKYDYEKANSVQSGYLPDVDNTLETQKGICFDYAALLACMARAQRVPAKLVTGYLSPEDMYHAWNLIYENGAWVWMDATLDAKNRGADSYTSDKQY